MAGAISGTTIAALMAMVAGSAMQYKAQQDASKRQQAETRASLARQAEFQQQAERKAMDTAQEFTTDNRSEKQQQIEENLIQEFIKPAESAQQINSAQSTTQGNVSNDYTAAKAGRELETMKTAQALARILGKTTSAGRLRTNESIRVADAASGIDQLGNFSRGQAGADQLAIQNAGRPSAGMMLGGSALQAAGGAALAGGANGTIGKIFGQSASAAQPAASQVMSGMPLGSGMASAPIPTGIGAADWTGATMPKGLGTGTWGLNTPAGGYKIPRLLG